MPIKNKLDKSMLYHKLFHSTTFVETDNRKKRYCWNCNKSWEKIDGKWIKVEVELVRMVSK